MENFLNQLKNEKLSNKHYYGDFVRTLFLTAALIMLISLPFVSGNIPVTLAVSIFAILFIAIIAGFTNPVQLGTAVINLGVSAVALTIFEYYAVKSFTASSFSIFFAVNQFLAIIFLVALYYSSKTFRAKILQKK